ncbi:hypothetical protein EDD15DRAFT_2383012 [Pisolithus albus]|nr:hypothetical protein EDD15DRAFT_2383012 [Pisolithus albus]
MDDCWQYQSFFALGLGFSILHHSASESMLTSPNTFVMKENHSKEWVERQARTLGITTECIAAYEARTVSDAELPIIRDFCSAAVIYDLPNYPGVEGRISRERTPEQNEEPEEGEMRDEPAPM